MQIIEEGDKNQNETKDIKFIYIYFLETNTIEHANDLELHNGQLYVLIAQVNYIVIHHRGENVEEMRGGKLEHSSMDCNQPTINHQETIDEKREYIGEEE